MDSPMIPLSAREIEVLKLIVRGYTSKRIGEVLHLSERTIEWYRRNLLRKTESANTASLISWAYKHGYV